MLMETFLSLSQDGRPPSDSASRQNSSRLKTWKIHKGRCEKIANFFDTRENAGMINWRELSIFEWLSMSPTSAWWTCNRAVVLGWSRHVPMLGEVSGSRKQEPRPRSPSRAGFKEMSNCPMCEDMACVSRYECWWYENSNFSLCTLVFKCWNLLPPWFAGSPHWSLFALSSCHPDWQLLTNDKRWWFREACTVKKLSHE